MKVIENNQKTFAIFGMIGPFFYALIWILGGILQPGYNHIRDDVSSLLAVGAPNRTLFRVIELGYILCMILFFLSLLVFLSNGFTSFLGPLFFIGNFVLEFFVMLFFPLDAGGEVISQTAQNHLTFVGLMVLLSMLGLLSLWRTFRNNEAWKRYANYTLITLGLSLVFGLGTVVLGSDMKGLIERLVASTLGQYFFVIALKIYNSSK